MSARSAQQLENLFDAKPVIVLKEMQKVLGSASRATIFRHLMKVSYCRSYNCNGRYYTKHDSTRYDRHGLFSYKGIHFSRDGNLSATVARLICESSFGHTQRELQELLQVRVQTSLLTMVHDKQLARFKVAGQFIYLHSDSEIRIEQLTKRRELFERVLSANLSRRKKMQFFFAGGVPWHVRRMAFPLQDGLLIGRGYGLAKIPGQPVSRIFGHL